MTAERQQAGVIPTGRTTGTLPCKTRCKILLVVPVLTGFVSHRLAQQGWYDMEGEPGHSSAGLSRFGGTRSLLGRLCKLLIKLIPKWHCNSPLQISPSSKPEAVMAASASEVHFSVRLRIRLQVAQAALPRSLPLLRRFALSEWGVGV